MSDLESLIVLNSRRASVLEVGGFRPTLEPTATHFGLTPLALPGEEWPVNAAGQPLQFICQLNLLQAPFVPDALQDVALLTFFVGHADQFIAQGCPRDSWCIRTYSSLDGLVPLRRGDSNVSDRERWLGDRGFECRWREVTDHPNYDDDDLVIPDGFGATSVHLQNVYGSKIGGYPSSVQHTVQWTAFVKQGDEWIDPLKGQVAFAFQIDSEPKVSLNWVDSGVVYVGRGQGQSAGLWFVSCQFY